MLASIKYHLSHLGDFSGREGRRTFWLWVLAIVLVNVLVSFVLSGVLTAGAMSAAVGQAKSGNEEAIQQAVLAQTLPNMAMLAWAGIALAVVNCVLMAAAFVRRLHDGGSPGAIALVPLVIAAYNAWWQVAQIGRMDELVAAAMQASSAADIVALQQDAGIQALLGWVPLLIVVGFGIVKSKPGANKWGEQPTE